MTSTDLATARIADLLTGLLTVEARMAGLGQHGAAMRAELNRRGAETYERDGVVPTWRGDDKLGVISYSTGKLATVVTDQDAFLDHAADHFPDNVTAHLTVPADLLPTVLELIGTKEALAQLRGWQPPIRLEAQPAWLKLYLEKLTTALDEDRVCDNETGELVPGLGRRVTGRTGVSVRLNPEAKARAVAELTDPMALAVLTAPLGQVAAAHAYADDDPPPPDLVGKITAAIDGEVARWGGAVTIPADMLGPVADDEVDHAAEGEPEYDDEPAVPLAERPAPLDPVGAAAHAVVVQGGFSTPAIEAFRILEDAVRILISGGALDARWRRGVLDTLAWIDAQPADDAELVGEQAMFAGRHPGDWRSMLTVAAGATAAPGTSSLARTVDEREFGTLDLSQLRVPELRDWCRRLQLDTSGTKTTLLRRLAEHRTRLMEPAR